MIGRVADRARTPIGVTVPDALLATNTVLPFGAAAIASGCRPTLMGRSAAPLARLIG